MHNPAPLALALSVSLLLAACNGGGTGSEGGAGFTAKIDGKEWASTEIGTTAIVVAAVPGTLVLQGTREGRLPGRHQAFGRQARHLAAGNPGRDLRRRLRDLKPGRKGSVPYSP